MDIDKIVIGGLVVTAAVGITVIYAISKSNDNDEKNFLKYYESAKNSSLIEKLVKFLSSLTKDLLLAIMEKVKGFIAELFFKPKMAVNENRVD